MQPWTRLRKNLARGWRYALVALLLALGVGDRIVVADEPQAKPAAQQGTISLFDGKTLDGWKSTKFGGEGDVEVEEGKILLRAGNPLTGITWTDKHPKMNYEISLQAMRVDGSDFFCGLTFPVGDDPCTFIIGGWGGGVIGLSSLDGSDASENETTRYQEFINGKWHDIRVRVTPERIETWLDGKQMADVETEGREIGIRPEVELSRPLGISCFSTTAALRDIKIKKLGKPE